MSLIASINVSLAPQESPLLFQYITLHPRLYLEEVCISKTHTCWNFLNATPLTTPEITLLHLGQYTTLYELLAAKHRTA